MKEYLPAIAAVIAGIFAILSALLTWRLKTSTDDKVRQLTEEKQKRDEITQLFTDTFSLFEQAMSQVLNREEFTLQETFSENNAKIHLLAPQHIVTKYCKVSALLESWSRLHAQASPRQMKMGDQTVTILQAPDPTEKYKEPAREEYNKLQEELYVLVSMMRAEVNKDA